MKDPRAEQWLTKHGVEWHCEKGVPLSLVDWDASLKNQARLKISLIPGHVDELAISILSGDQLPDPIGYYNKDGRIIIISGNHRVAAYRSVNELELAHVEKIDWYIVSTYTWKIDVLTRTSNIYEGEGTPMVERLEQAKHLVRLHNYSRADAAKECRISATAVDHGMEGDEVRERLARYQFTDTIPLTTLCKLYRIKQDYALVETAKLVKEAVLSGDEAAEVATRVEKAAKSEKQQQLVINQLRKDYKDRIARTKRGELKRQIVPTIRFRKAVNAINSTRPEAVTPLEPELQRKAKSAIKKLEEVTRSAYST